MSGRGLLQRTLQTGVPHGARVRKGLCKAASEASLGAPGSRVRDLFAKVFANGLSLDSNLQSPVGDPLPVQVVLELARSLRGQEEDGLPAPADPWLLGESRIVVLLLTAIDLGPHRPSEDPDGHRIRRRAV